MKVQKQVHFHSLRVLAKDFYEQFIQVVYLPEETRIFLEQIQEKDFEKEFRLSEFRSIILGRYPQVIMVDFSKQALEGIQPWLYMKEDATVMMGKLIHTRFINWSIRLFKSREKDIQIPDVVRNDLVEQNRVSISDCFSFHSVKRVLNSWFIMQFVQRKKTLVWEVPNKDGIHKQLEFPEEWFYCFNGSEYEAVSAPIPITELKNKNDAKQYASYVISVHFEEVGSSSEYILHVKSSLRRWIYKPLLQAGKSFFPRNHRRSLYLIKSESGRRTMIRFPMNSYNNKVYLSFYNQTIEMFEELGFTPNLSVILSQPSSFSHTEPLSALIPYKADDKNYPNVIEAGISRNEKMLLFNMFSGCFPSLNNNHPETRLIETPRTSLKGGSISIEHPSSKLDETMVIELFSRNNDLQFIIEEALSLFVKELKDYESRFTLKRLGECQFQIIDESFQSALHITFVNQRNVLHLIQDLEAVPGGSKFASERKRIKEIQETLTVDHKGAVYSLIEIKNYDNNPQSDPKNAIEKGFVEVKRLTQCFHPIDLLSHEEKVQKIKSCLADMLARKGFVNQMISVYKDLLSENTYYFPICLPIRSTDKKDGSIYIMTRMKNGEVHVKHKGTDWMSLEDSLLFLTSKNKQKQFQTGNHDFVRFIEEEAKSKEDIVVFQRDELPDYFVNLDDEDYPFTLAVFDVSPHRNPYIEYIDKYGAPSAGTFLAESNGEYFAVPPKINTKTGKNYNTKQDVNSVFQTRHTLRLNVSRPNDKVAISLHLMRNLSITFNYFLNHPLPYHLLGYHRKLLN